MHTSLDLCFLQVSRAAGGALRQDLPPVNDLDKDSVLYKAAVKIQSRYRGYIIRKVMPCQALFSTCQGGFEDL